MDPSFWPLPSAPSPSGLSISFRGCHNPFQPYLVHDKLWSLIVGYVWVCQFDSHIAMMQRMSVILWDVSKSGKLFSSRKQPSFEVHLKQCQYPKKPKHGQATCLEISQKVGWEDQIIFHNDQTFHAPAACKENHTMSACKPGCSMSVQEVTPPTEHPDELELVKCHKYFRQVHTVTFDQSHKNI